MHEKSATKRHIIAICLLLLAVFSTTQTAFVNVAAAEPSSYSAQIVEQDGRHILSWDAFVGTFDYYVIELNDDVLVDGHNFEYIDVTDAIAVGGEYDFTVYASFDGDLTQIATTSTVRYITLPKVDDVQIVNGLATWSHINGATDYDVFVNGIKIANIASTSICVADYVGKTGVYSLQILPKHDENPYYDTDIPLSFAFESTEYASFDGYPVYFALYDTLTISLENCADAYRYVVLDGDDCVLEQETADNFITIPSESGKIYSLYVFAVYETHVQLLNSTQYSIIDGAVKIYE